MFDSVKSTDSTGAALEQPQPDMQELQQDQQLQQDLQAQARQLWRKRITSHRDVGLATLAYIYICKSRRFGAAVTVLAFLLLASQLAIAVILAINQADEYILADLGWCPGSRYTPSDSQKSLAFFIGVLYIVKLGTKALAEIKDLNSESPLNTVSHCPYQLFVCMDHFMDVAFEPLVYVLNLFVVSRTSKELDMVLNAVALEFILKLDNEFKAMLLENFSITDDMLDKVREAEIRAAPDGCDYHQAFINLFTFALLLVLGLCFVFTLVVTVWFIPCKFALDNQEL